MSSTGARKPEILNTKTGLRRRIVETIPLLKKEFGMHFKPCFRRFDFENKRLFGANGYFLQWREDSTSTGGVSLQRLDTKNAIKNSIKKVNAAFGE